MSSHYVESSRLDYQSSGSVIRLLSGVFGGLVSCFIWKAFSCCVFFPSWVASGFLSRIGLCFFFVLWIPLPQPVLCGVLVIPSVFFGDLACTKVMILGFLILSDFHSQRFALCFCCNKYDWLALSSVLVLASGHRSSVFEGSAIITLQESRGRRRR